MKYFSPTYTYIPIRYGSLAISFLLSLFYSKELGLLNRAIAGFVFLGSGLLIILLTQGLGLKILHLHNSKMLSKSFAYAYLKSALSLLIIGLVVLNFGLFIFLQSLGHLEINIFVVVSFYFVIAFSGQLYYDFLLRTSKYYDLNLLLLNQSLLSVLFFYLFLFYFRFSAFVSIFTSISFAFTFSAVISILKDAEMRKFFTHTFRNTPLKLNQSNSTHAAFFTKSMLKTLLIPVVERLDKVFVLLFFPLEVFSQVIVAQSFLYILKPVQDIWVNGLPASSVENHFNFKTLPIYINVFLAFSIFLGTFSSYYILVQVLLGDTWLLSFGIFNLLFIFEIAKLFFLGRFTKSIMRKAAF